MDLEERYEVQQKKHREVNAVAFPVECACDDFIGADEIDWVRVAKRIRQLGIFNRDGQGDFIRHAADRVAGGICI